MKTDPRKWPKLSETLTHERKPGVCQSCGIERNRCLGDTGAETWCTLWIECDHHDEPTRVVVSLCSSCSGRLIEPHPRLYRKVPENKPVPGAMPHLCTDCRFRTGLQCESPELKANGGPGLCIVYAEPVRGFIDGRGKDGKRTGGMFEHYRKPADECKGRAPLL